ncbi:type IV pilus modification PilV family protein [Acidocella aromatica]|uniref:General secretion pathway protein I n=1 Tax=Acidocella aromatica TaxID=1303579 RepID=A0A840VKW7_9PROT|nr:prepilin-type N-terminal cleavage/methylation domain-containing protein [Acidocella aromatica]MBB5372211.1 general secretion pathway protein I [Acidocella aromatica]
MRRDSGFTLLEVMVAFVIAALASLVLYQVAFNASAQALTAAHYQEALVRAQSRLAALGPLTQLQPGRSAGDDGGGFSWEMSIIPEQSNGQITLYAVRLTERFGTRAVTLTTERVAPNP